MEQFKDMHIHTVYSDGTSTPQEIVKQLKKENVTTFALTDHDRVDAIKELKQVDMEWYTGVEVSTIYHQHKIHLLSYGFDVEHPSVTTLLSWIQNNRKLRFYDMVKRAEDAFRIEFDIDYFRSLEKKTTLGRPHLMQYLTGRGLGTYQEIMTKINKQCSTPISYRADLKWAIECLKAAKGLLVIAHPKEIEEESHIHFDTIIGYLVSLGIDGIEVYHSSHTDEDTNRFHRLALQYHLLESGGSDYHGLCRKERILGHVTKSGQKIKQLSLVEELRRRTNFDK